MNKKTNWQTKKLGEVCDFQNGFAFKSKLFREAGFPVLRISNIQNDGLSYNRLVFFDKKNYKEDFDKYEALKGDLVIAMSGATTGKLAICDADEIFYLNQRVGKFIPRKDLSNYYLYYFLSTRIEENLKISAGSAQPNLSTDQIKGFQIPLPPLPEQHRIVKILDEVFENIARAKENTEKNLKNAKELFESYLQGVFEDKSESWEYARLGDICQINDGTHFSPQNTSEGEYMYITAKNIKPYFIDLTKLSYISEKDHKEIYARCSPVKGDVLYIKDGATAGIATLNTLDEEFSLLSSVALLKCSSKILNRFLVHYMNSKIGKKNFLGYIDGAAITRLTLIKIKNVYLSLPSISEQKTIVQKLDALSLETKKLEAMYQKKLEDLEELKKSVLRKAFSGEL